MESFNLKLSDWKFKSVEDADWLPAVVPGCVHTDLQRNQRIRDPFYGTNEKDVQWVDKKDWKYETTFDVPEQLFHQSSIELVFHGLDTYAEVDLNGHRILNTDHMFLRWNVNVKPWLKRQDNRLHIRFRSPIQKGLEKLERLGYGLPAANDQSDVGGLGDKKVSVFTRKAPYHYGWDWGPRFVTSGIWRDVELVGWTGVRITDVYFHQLDVQASKAKLEARLEVEAERELKGNVVIRTEQLQWTKNIELKRGLQSVTVELEIAEPKLWWCNGLGDPHLYAFSVELYEDPAHQPLAAETVKTGLRSIRLVREKDVAGTSFTFVLNGVPVFAKGANHIPNDSFITEVTEERYRHEIITALKTNMNMLRVWGGGIYEEDVFYELCDEYGILVWQDFMFACSMYPGDAEFLEQVEKEAEYNVRRLRNHPCIALWCGNNEIDVAWAHFHEKRGWGWKEWYTPDIREKIWADYEAIFHRILADAVAAHAPEIDYWPSSPMRELTGDVSQHAFDATGEGDVHYWGVWHKVEPFENYNVHVGRFMSEYGFQSFPEYKTVKAYAEEQDMALESEVMLAHQKNGAGNQKIKQYMDLYLREPKDFPSFLYMSQVLQSEAMKMAIEAHRRRKPFCMGTLYWQMNDCWPVASWAGMDYYGRWKAMQYAAKRSFKDVIVSIDGSKEDEAHVYIVSDLREAWTGVLVVELIHFSGTCLKRMTKPVEAAADSAMRVMSFTVDTLLRDVHADAANVVLHAYLEREGTMIATTEHYFVPTKDLQLEPAVIQVDEVEGSGGTSFKLSSNTLARQVWISSEVDGVFSDNFFDLLPDKPVVIQFEARSKGQDAFVTASPGALQVQSLIDALK